MDFSLTEREAYYRDRVREFVETRIRPRNKEQHYALDLLLNDDVKLVTLVGKAGTGKTLLALAAGLQKVIEEQGFHKLLVSRPIFPLGRDIGFLPGDMHEKMAPYLRPLYDALGDRLGGKRVRQLTVHHKDGNHDHNPPDGSNWENLCADCHEAEHTKGLLGDYLSGR